LTEERLLKELDKVFAVTPQQTEHGVHIPLAQDPYRSWFIFAGLH
jgi:hypothetical protein